jgi:hypothetical protein
MGRLEALDEGRCVLVGSTSNPAMYAGEWLAHLPFHFRVEGGPELVEAARVVARRMAAAVSDDPPGSSSAGGVASPTPPGADAPATRTMGAGEAAKEAT